jgi:ATP-dependent Lon protease
LKTVLIPKENEKDLAEIPDNVKEGLNIIPVAMVDEVLSAALVREPLPNAISSGPPDEAPSVPIAEKAPAGDDITAH